MARKKTIRTLSDDDILTIPNIRRRRLLAMVGTGAVGAAAIATGLVSTPSRAVDSDLGANADPVVSGIDSDTGANADPVGGVDADTGANADPVGGGSDPVDSDTGAKADSADAD